MYPSLSIGFRTIHQPRKSCDHQSCLPISLLLPLSSLSPSPPNTIRLAGHPRQVFNSAPDRYPLHRTALYCNAWNCTALLCVPLHCTALCCTTLHCVPLHCTLLCSTALHCVPMHCTVFHCTAQRSTVLHCIRNYYTLMLCLKANISSSLRNI